MSPMKLLARLEWHARHAALRPALRISALGAIRDISYAELFEGVQTFKSRVEQLAPRGSTVAIAGTSSRTFVEAYLGTLAAGCIVHPVPRGSTASEMKTSLEATNARVLVSDEGIQQVPGHDCERAFDLDHDPGLFLPSSGTTGLPKIAVRSRSSLDAVASNVALAAGLTPEDVVIAAVPMSHSYGMENGLLGPLWAGSCISIFDRAGGIDTGELPDELDRCGVTVFPAVPFMVDMLARLAADRSLRLRCIYTAGSPLPPGVAQAFEHKFGVGIGQLYGATELGSVTFANPGGPASCVGRPLPGVSILILDPDHPDASKPLSRGEEGHVAIRAESMLTRYLGDNANEGVFAAGHFLTGDLGSLDSRGMLTISGRIKLLIDVGGFKVNPLEVERTLLEHPSVGEVVVLPIKVTETVARLRALIAPRTDSVPIDELRAFAKERLSPHKVPRVFEVVSRLPKTPSGKVIRRELEAGA